MQRSGAGLSPRQRLRKTEFAQVFRGGKLIRGRVVSVLVRTNQVQIPRLGMIVPKRQHPRSVDRNRIKRVIREWFRCNQGKLAGRDWIVRLGIGGNSAQALQHGWLRFELERLASGSTA